MELESVKELEIFGVIGFDGKTQHYLRQLNTEMLHFILNMNLFCQARHSTVSKLTLIRIM